MMPAKKKFATLAKKTKRAVRRDESLTINDIVDTLQTHGMQVSLTMIPNPTAPTDVYWKVKV